MFRAAGLTVRDHTERPQSPAGNCRTCTQTDPASLLTAVCYGCLRRPVRSEEGWLDLGIIAANYVRGRHDQLTSCSAGLQQDKTGLSLSVDIHQCWTRIARLLFSSHTVADLGEVRQRLIEHAAVIPRVQIPGWAPDLHAKEIICSAFRHEGSN